MSRALERMKSIAKNEAHTTSIKYYMHVLNYKNVIEKEIPIKESKTD